MNEIQTTEIKQIELEILFYKKQTVQSIFEIGERLITAKELIPHGEWGEWLDERVDISSNRAREFMRVTREFSNQQTSVSLTLDKMLALTTVPREEREDFIKDNPVEDMTTRELQQAIKEKKELEKKIQELENKEPVIVERERITEVAPNDYGHLKARESELERQVRSLENKLQKQIDPEDYNRVRKEYTDKANEVHELKKQIEQAIVIDGKEVHQKKLKDTALTFSNHVHSFINSVGGLGWMIDYLDELPKYEKDEYIKSVELLDKWITTIKSNL